MSAAELITTLQAEGLRLGLDDTGALRCYGDRTKVNAYLPAIRAHKPELLRLLAERPATSGEGPAALPAGAEPLDTEGPPLPEPWDEIRRWIQRGWRAEFSPPGPDGRQSITWIPPGQWEPVQPDAKIQADDSVVESARTDGTMQRPLQAVRCGDCAHFRPDTIGDGTGIGSCLAGVPLHGLPRYPKAERHCPAFLPAGQPRPLPLNSQDRFPTDPRPNPYLHSDSLNHEDTDMALTLTESGENFELVPAGTYPARCYRVIDLGTQKVSWQGTESPSKKLLLQWEVLDPDARMSDGRPFAISKRYTASLNEKAALRKDLESWRGKAFAPEELRGFDVSKLLGQPCLLSVIHVEKNGRTYANISALMRAPKGMAVPEAVNELLAWDFDRPDWNAFEKFTPQLQETLEATPEWAKLPTPAQAAVPRTAPPVHGWEHLPKAPGAAPANPPAAQPAPASAGGEDFDDEIPW
jgi:hypothetical protein